jgi:hypothetical protein
MTQAEYDYKVNSIVEQSIRLANESALLRKQSDPIMFKREEELVMLQNLIYALSYYDVSSSFFTDTEINEMFELAIQISQPYPG